MYTKAIVIAFLAYLASADITVYSDAGCVNVVATYSMDQVLNFCTELPAAVIGYSLDAEEVGCQGAGTYYEFGLYPGSACTLNNSVGGGCGVETGNSSISDVGECLLTSAAATYVNGYEAGNPGPPRS